MHRAEMNEQQRAEDNAKKKLITVYVPRPNEHGVYNTVSGISYQKHPESGVVRRVFPKPPRTKAERRKLREELKQALEVKRHGVEAGERPVEAGVPAKEAVGAP